MSHDYDTTWRTYTEARTKLIDFASKNKMGFNQILHMKSIFNTQKFSRYFQKEITRIFDHSEEPEFSIYDARNKNGGTQEYKYATYSEERGASFPQMMNLDHTPETYIIAIFFGDEIRVYEISGKELHNSVIRYKGKRAHANNKNQLRNNIKIRSEEMDFLEKHYSQILIDKIKGATFSCLK